MVELLCWVMVGSLLTLVIGPRDHLCGLFFSSHGHDECCSCCLFVLFVVHARDGSVGPPHAPLHTRAQTSHAYLLLVTLVTKVVVAYHGHVTPVMDPPCFQVFFCFVFFVLFVCYIYLYICLCVVYVNKYIHAL